jgi:hypothetical protein
MKDLEKRFNEFRNDGEHCSIDDSNLNIYDVAMLLAFIQSELSRQRDEIGVGIDKLTKHHKKELKTLKEYWQNRVKQAVQSEQDNQIENVLKNIEHEIEAKEYENDFDWNDWKSGYNSGLNAAIQILRSYNPNSKI